MAWYGHRGQKTRSMDTHGLCTDYKLKIGRKSIYKRTFPAVVIVYSPEKKEEINQSIESRNKESGVNCAVIFFFKLKLLVETEKSERFSLSDSISSLMLHFLLSLPWRFIRLVTNEVTSSLKLNNVSFLQGCHCRIASHHCLMLNEINAESTVG